MKSSPSIILARRGLSREWSRSLISALSIALGVALMIAADLLSTAVTSEIDKTPEAQAITGFISEQLNVGLTAVSIVIVVGAGFLVFNSLSMAVTQRLADIGRLRAIGMTSSQILRSIQLEASFLGMLGVLIGIPAGVLLTSSVMGFLETTSSMFNQFGKPEISASRLFLSGALGLVIALIASVAPARRASRVSPLEILRRSQSYEDGDRRNGKTWIATVLMASTLVYLILFPTAFWIEPPWDTRLLLLLLALWLICFLIALPGWIGACVGALEGVITRLFGPSGMLGLRNSLRMRYRVSYTVLTLAIGVAMVVGVTGYITYWFDELFFRTMEATLRDDGSMGVFPINVAGGMQAYTSVERFTMPEGLILELEEAVHDEAIFAQVYFVLIPELSFMGEDYFSFILDPQDLWATRDLYFTFSKGNWEQAIALMQQDCGILMTPLVAAKNDVDLYQSMWLETLRGPVECTVAGIGSPMVGASIVSDSIVQDYGLTTPVSLVVLTHPDTDREALKEKMGMVLDRYDGVWLTDLSIVYEMQWEAMKSVKSMMNGMLILAILGAALGVVAVLRMGFQERQGEFMVFRATGATQGQVKGMILVEAGIIGLLGGLLGLILGCGLILIYTLVTGGGFMGFIDLPVREATLTTLRSIAGNGVAALILSPLLTVLVAWAISKRFFRSRMMVSMGGDLRPWVNQE